MLILAAALLLPLMQQRELIHLECGIRSPQPIARLIESAEEIVRCDEGVIVEQGDTRVEADWMAYDPKAHLVTAGDRVKFTRKAGDLTVEQVNGGLLTFDTQTKATKLTNVSGEVEGFFLKAEEYERRADGSTSFKRMSLTACPGDCPNWGFQFKDALVIPGKSFHGSSSTFRVRGFPILKFPAMTIRSGKDERQSGFMIPGYSKSKLKGTSVREAYYWVLGRSADLMLTGEYFSERGPAGTIDFAATPNAATRIEVSEFFVKDRKNQGGQRTHISFLSDFDKNWRAVAKVDITSDLPFRQVFEENFNVISSPIEQSLAFLTRNGPHSSVNFLYNRSAVFYPDQSVALRKFPAVDFQLPTNSVSGRIPVYFSLDAGYTGSSRRDDRIDTSSFMQRVDVHPSFEVPVLRSSWLTWSNRVGVRDTMYTHSLNPDVKQRTLNRGVFEYEMSLVGPQMEKDFGSWKHVIEPTLEYRNIKGVDRFRSTIVVDETDLITDTNEIEYGLTQRFFSKWEFLTWRVAQKMYFDQSFGGALVSGRRNTLDPLMDLTGFAFSDGEPRKFSPIVSTVRLATTPNTSTDVEIDYDTQRHEFRSAGIMGDLNRGIMRTSVGYFFNKRTAIREPNNQLRALVAVGNQYRPGLSAGFGFSYDLVPRLQEDGRYRRIFQGSAGQVYYNARCFGLSFEVSQVDLGPRQDFGWRVSISLKNLGTFGNLRPQERLF